MSRSQRLTELREIRTVLFEAVKKLSSGVMSTSLAQGGVSKTVSYQSLPALRQELKRVDSEIDRLEGSGVHRAYIRAVDDNDSNYYDW